MRFDVLTIFPEMFQSFWNHGIVHQAIKSGKIQASAADIRDFAEGRHRVTDDRPYGGGCGMVMKPEPLARAIKAARCRCPEAKTVLLSPQGAVFNQPLAQEMARQEGLVLVCGRYEGVDERICQKYIDAEVSIGDYILTGGETAAMVIIEAVTRLIPGTLGGSQSAEKETFSNDLVEHGHYTRPPLFEDSSVPEVLLSGNHGAIEEWRLEASLIRTFLKRPDLLQARALTQRETAILQKWCERIEQIIQSQSSRGADALSGGQ